MEAQWFIIDLSSNRQCAVKLDGSIKNKYTDLLFFFITPLSSQKSVEEGEESALF